MKRTMITKIGDYENITTEIESLEEGLQEYLDIHAMFDDKQGLNVPEWAKFRKDFLMSEGKDQDIEEHEKLNKSQRWWAHQTKLTLESINNNEE